MFDSFDDLDQDNLADWRYFVGWTDAEFYHNPIEDDSDYLRGFADRYALLECEGNRNVNA